MQTMIPEQLELRQELPIVIGNIDYTRFRETLERIDEIIELGKLDKEVVRYAIRKAEKSKKRNARKERIPYKGLSEKEKLRIQKVSRQGLRCGIARHLLGEAYREFSCRLADSALLQRFCLIDHWIGIKVPSKSTLDRYEKMVPEKVIRKVVGMLTMEASQDGGGKLRLEEGLSLDEFYVDTTCVKANIHYPVDWVLLRDATRTLMKSVKIIRREGLKNRMEAPEKFIREMNCLSIQMSQTRRQKESKKKRKGILRKMKGMVDRVEQHARRHRELLENFWRETELKEGEVKEILKRIDNVLEQLPRAERQAHERIIGERVVPNAEKILSLYEPDIHPIVRGKASSEVEFGNTLLLGEQGDGVIVDWKLYCEQSPSDSGLLQKSLERFKKAYKGKQPMEATTDRGFYSEANRRYLEEEEIEDYMCPRGVKDLTKRMGEEIFCERQRRRGQTEGRIGILKNNFLGRPLRSKGFAYRELSVSWGILAHNLWVIARLSRVQEAELLQKAA